MDRVLSLLAAFVGLVAISGALVVQIHSSGEQARLATEIAQLKASISILTASQGKASAAPVEATPVAEVAAVAAPQPRVDDGVADALLALQDRIAAVEQRTLNQDDQLEQVQAGLSDLASRPVAPVTAVAAAKTAQSPAPAALSPDGPTKDCIPLGTRFMATSGDSFPICKTKAVVKVAAVSDGETIITGAGSVSPGGSGSLDTPGCTVQVFSADSSGYAEMRVTCI